MIAKIGLWCCGVAFAGQAVGLICGHEPGWHAKAAHVCVMLMMLLIAPGLARRVAGR